MAGGIREKAYVILLSTPLGEASPSQEDQASADAGGDEHCERSGLRNECFVNVAVCDSRIGGIE